MNKLVMTILGIAFVLASLASFAVYKAVRPGGSGAERGGQTVLVAARTLEAGTVIKENDIRTAQWPGNLPKGAITKREDALGRGVVTTILEGELVVELRLARAGAGGGLAALIPNGKRACAVKVNEVVGLAGFVVPGMRVDV
ncbi:MAG: Flp pilus assembly protein CpaB, partial [Bryobacteraceae bacterium]|nr:Flp pilus assembly protein CpaB [Bryobacteraceae bacterium]